MIQAIMPGVLQIVPERKLTDDQRKKEIDELINVLDQKIADYQNFRGECSVKHGKRPTRAQKNVIKANGLNPNNWLVSKNLQHEHRLIIVHRNTGTVRRCWA